MVEWHRRAPRRYHHRHHPGARRRRRTDFGIAEIDPDHRIVGFEEKPQHGHAARSVFNPEMVSASMGIYVFNTDVLLRLLQEDAQNESSSHDFGKDVIPGRARLRRA